MRTIIYLVSILILAKVKSHDADISQEDLEQWIRFKHVHSKVYESEEEETKRKLIFLENLEFVTEHNKKYEKAEVTFSVEINEYADLEESEFDEKMKGLRLSDQPREGLPFDLPWIDPPEYVDWTEQGAVTPVKNQRQCGSCWAFSATGTLESQIYIKTGQLVSLSEQNLVDCSTPFGNSGCNGGFPHKAFEYVKTNGITEENTYPYEEKDGECRFNQGDQVNKYTIKDHVDLPQEDEMSLQQAVAQVGPISVGFESPNELNGYKGGVFEGKFCTSKTLNHAVLVVGYGSENGQDYWLMKNSWGTDWGENGYFRLARNSDNACNISSLASYPILY